MCASAMVRSNATGGLAAWPWEDLAPLSAWIAERTSENEMRHLNQQSVELAIGSPILTYYLV